MARGRQERHQRFRYSVLGAACAVALGGVSNAALAYQCSDLTSVTTADATITSAAIVNAGTVVGGATVPVQMCRVQGVARPSSDSEIKFEVWLPPTAASWSGGRMKVNGTGGYAGSVPYARLAQDVGDGFVSAGSNMGHDGGENASWTLNRPEKVKDWGLRAHYSVATAAKAVANALYATPVKYSYFEGCSNGGRQALMMAQNYPELFDGIVAGAPSNFYPDLLMWLLWTGKQLTPVAGGAPSVSTAKRNAVTARVLQACDALDGLEDGQITDPRQCKFDIKTMGPSGDGTLTADELKVFEAMYDGPRSATGIRRYTGAKLGSEADWNPLFADNGGYGPFIGHYVYSLLSPPFDWRKDVTWDDPQYGVIKSALTPVTAAPSPDIRKFVARGGKIIQYHGLNDSVVVPDGSVGYFHALAEFERIRNLPKTVADKQIENLTPQVLAAHGEAFGNQVRQYHRLFLLPAVGHCGGSTGPSSIGGGAPEPPAALRTPETHVVRAVMKWVETGDAPEKIVATRLDGNNIVRQRPVCPYPQRAVYRGVGDINSADSFTCETTPLPQREIGEGDLLHALNALRQRELLLPNR